MQNKQKSRKNYKKFKKNAKVQRKSADIIYVIAEKLKNPDAQVYIRAEGNHYFNQPPHRNDSDFRGA